MEAEGEGEVEGVFVLLGEGYEAEFVAGAPLNPVPGCSRHN